MKKQVLTDPFFEPIIEKINTVESGKIIPRLAVIHPETDRLLGFVSDKYQIVKNADLVKIIEDYLVETDTKFVRSEASTNDTGSKFYARYRFPGMEVNFGEHTTGFGTVPDRVQFALSIRNGYDGSAGLGFDVGGYRLVCLNGLEVHENVYSWKKQHTGEDLINEVKNMIIVNFETAKEMFLSKLAPSWKELLEIDFDKVRAAVVLRALELTTLYANWLGTIYKERLKNDRLKTMWDFYNMITWFTSHVVRERNRSLAREISINASQQLLGEAVL